MSNILITGAAGYIGGSILAEILAKSALLKKDQIFAAVRSDTQVGALSKLGVTVLQLDLTNEEDVAENVARNDINIVIHTSSAIDPKTALYLITALSKQGKVSGKRTYFIHTSGMSAFYKNTGWPAGDFKDTDGVFETEKRLAASFPIRNTDVSVIEHAAAQGVTSFVVVPSLVYGRGSGEWNKLSVVLPVYVEAIISNKAVYKFPGNTKVSAVHISDLTVLYGQIVEKILQEKPIPNGKEGYYFGKAHELFFGDVLDKLAEAMEVRGLLADSTTRVYPDDASAAKILGVPEQFVQILWNSGDDIIPEIPKIVAWKPKWDKEHFFEHIDDEIQDVLDLGKAKSSLIDSLFKATRG
ncbi:hypothetical protein N7448_002136 [Penicillium atrosanguineum]|uniref:NAD-dependent epimerase/dehydratase domain-containing protein n=1 Tax=Penicillium atrosanguineum TaxID=1132637 RepID=A0A9W9L8V1_9EURO|nr:uncharacterized protein N7443_005538 [Penicillium atrosanguineum]KAJ5128417.1 hypothetical protein N7526_006583 [Penicillium atrosanguineum]KAJ5144744.1 hypothetical protein N7448_002136 [Penicillium atrosanguineum]KAJ5300536.1 hypothetical protein N7443_005538 [Penicillium atrosanguineum]KAJ5311179.1 hypothetical protein N7476_007039 [Penicillium atrosanguineum]